jgi:hypothetical protein
VVVLDPPKLAPSRWVDWRWHEPASICFYLFFLLPFWCRRREALAKAERKYMALNEAGRCTHCALKLRLFPQKAALRLVAPGGILLTCALGICDNSCLEIPSHFDRKDTRCAGKKKEATLGLVI